MGTEMLSNEEIVDYYKEDAMKLFHYLSWLESKMGQRTSTVYGADGIATNSIPFPVYDSTLLSFIKEADKKKQGKYIFINSLYLPSYVLFLILYIFFACG